MNVWGVSLDSGYDTGCPDLYETEEGARDAISKQAAEHAGSTSTIEWSEDAHKGGDFWTLTARFVTPKRRLFQYEQTWFLERLDVGP